MAEAEEMFVWVLKGCEKAVGKDHPRTQKLPAAYEAYMPVNDGVALLFTLIQGIDDIYQSRQKLANLDLSNVR
jgi:hypothetical protein